MGLLELKTSFNVAKRRLILRARGRTNAPLVGEVGFEKFAADVVPPTPAAPVSSIIVLIFIFNDCEYVTNWKQIIVLSPNSEFEECNIGVNKNFVPSFDP